MLASNFDMICSRFNVLTSSTFLQFPYRQATPNFWKPSSIQFLFASIIGYRCTSTANGSYIFRENVFALTEIGNKRRACEVWWNLVSENSWKTTEIGCLLAKVRLQVPSIPMATSNEKSWFRRHLWVFGRERLFLWTVFRITNCWFHGRKSRRRCSTGKWWIRLQKASQLSSNSCEFVESRGVTVWDCYLQSRIFRLSQMFPPNIYFLVLGYEWWNAYWSNGAVCNSLWEVFGK